MQSDRENYLKGLESNIWKRKVSTIFAGLAKMITPMLILYYLSLGLDLITVGALTSTFFIVAFITEVPTGVVADHLGRKTSLLLSLIALTLSSFVLLLGNSLAVLFLSAILFGLHISFKSGADIAIIYDSLVELKKADLFKKVNGSIFAFAMFSFAFSFLLSGFIVKYFSFQAIFIIGTVFGALALIPNLLLTEPKHHKKLTFRNYFKHIKESVTHIGKIPRLRNLIIFFVILSGFTEPLFRFHQAYFSAVGLPIEYIGVLYALFNVLSGIGAFYAHKIENKLGERISIFLIAIIPIITLILLGYYATVFGALILIFEQFKYGFSNPIEADYVNRHIKSKNRATVLSLSAFFEWILKIIFSLYIGYLGSSFGIVYSYFIIGITLLVLLAYPTYQLTKKHRH